MSASDPGTLPTVAEAEKALRWLAIDYEAGRELADEIVGKDIWVSTEPDGGLLMAVEYLARALHALRKARGYEVAE